MITAIGSPSATRRRPLERILLVDVCAPGLVVMYMLLKFEPFASVLRLPGSASWLVFPALAVIVLAVTPTSRLVRIPINWATFAFAFWIVASRLWTESVAATDFAIRSEVPALVLLVLVAGTIEPRRLIRVLVATFCVIAFWSLATSIALPNSRVVTFEAGVDEPQLGFRGMFGHKNELGMFVVFGLCLVLAFAQGVTRRLLLVLMIATILGTRSATAGSGMFAVMFIWFWLSAIGSQRSPRERSLLLAISVVSAVTAVLLAFRLLPALLGVYQKDLTLSGRTVIWSESLELIRRQPLHGFGFGGLWVNPTPAIIDDLRRQIGFSAAHAHNGALGLVLEVGLIGLGLFVVLLVRVGALMVYCVRRPALSDYGRWALLTLIALVLMATSEPLFDGADLGLLALVAVVLQRLKNDEQLEPSGVSAAVPADGSRPDLHSPDRRVGARERGSSTWG